MSDSDFNLNSPVIFQTVGGAAGDATLTGRLNLSENNNGIFNADSNGVLRQLIGVNSGNGINIGDDKYGAGAQLQLGPTSSVVGRVEMDVVAEYGNIQAVSVNPNDYAFLAKASTDGGFMYIINNRGIPVLVNGVSAKGLGYGTIYGLDNRTGLTAADASAITIYAVPASGGLFRISGGLDVTAYTSGTATYTISWTDVNGTAHTKTASLSAVGHADINALGLERVKGGTNITAQLTGTFVATVSVDACSEEVA